MKYKEINELSPGSCEGCVALGKDHLCGILRGESGDCWLNHVIFVEDKGENEMNDDLDLKVGDKVECDAFGEGIVIGVEPSEIPYCYYMVNFPNEGTISFSKKGHFSPGSPPKFKLRKVSKYPDLTGATKVRIRPLDEMAKDPELKVVCISDQFYIKKPHGFWTWTYKTENYLKLGRILNISDLMFKTDDKWRQVHPWMVEEVLERESDINVEYKITSNGKSVDVDTISDESLIALIRGGK